MWGAGARAAREHNGQVDAPCETAA
jgi:hypothetical protein